MTRQGVIDEENIFAAQLLVDLVGEDRVEPYILTIANGAPGDVVDIPPMPPWPREQSA